MPKTIPKTALITGASGLIGQALTQQLLQQGWQVNTLVRHSPKTENTFYWNPETGECDAAAFKNVDTLFHLAGENIASHRWTNTRKGTILANRRACMRTLFNTIEASVHKPKTALFASAIGYYGHGTHAVTESASAGQGFAAEVCQAIEEFGTLAETRAIYPRIGVVLAKQGGALAKMLPAFRLGLGGPLGSGTQHFSWISLPDIVQALIHCAEEASLNGPVNLTAPHPLPQKDFAQQLGAALNRPAFMPMPNLMAKLLFGQMGDELLLNGIPVLPRKLEDTGFTFQHPTAKAALVDIFTT